MDSNKYYFINIQIPLQILSSKDNKLLSDRIDITFSECQTLPSIKENHTTFVSDKIREFIDTLSQKSYPEREPDPGPEQINEPPIKEKESEPEPEPIKESEPAPETRVCVTKSQQKYPRNPNANISFKNRKDKKSREFTKKNYDYSNSE